MKEEIDIRKIKIQSMYITARWKNTKVVPRLLICGDWFKNAGFEPKDVVKIIVQNNLLIIQKEKNEKE